MLLFLLPFAVFGQLTVVDGPDINSDIDTQSSTIMYQGSFDAPISIWDAAGGTDKKFYFYSLIKEGGGPSDILYDGTYPENFSEWTTDPPELPVTISITSDMFFTEDGPIQLEPGETYFLVVDAKVAPSLDTIASSQSDGVLILGGEEPPGDEPVVSGQISLSATPSSLSFAAGVNELDLQLQISASGTGSISVNSIREDRVYDVWGQERGSPEGVNLSIPSGFTETISRQINLSNLERSKALGSGTEGSFMLQYVVSGQDSWGNPVSTTLNIPVSVSGAPASSLNVQGVSIELPESPYFQGETVIGSTITIEANGSGTVLGQVYVDGSLEWSENPAFAISVNGTTTFEIQGALPTVSPGDHTVRVDLINPSGLTGQNIYEVSAEDPPFPPQTLTLIPGAAELSNFDGFADVDNIDGDVQYTFNGTADLRLLSMGGQVLQGAAVNNLVVRYEDINPDAAVIAGGTVEKDGDGQELVSYADGYLRITRVFYDYASDPARLTTRAGLFIPRLNITVVTLDDMDITDKGLQLKSYSWDKADPKRFNAFGVSFRLHDVDGNKALVLSDDPGKDRQSFALSGSIAWKEKEGANEDAEEKEIVTFSGLTFFSDGEFEGGISVSEDFDLIPGMLTITEAGLVLEDDVFAFKLGGEIKNLPSPLNELTSTFSLSFDTEGNLQGNIVPIDELSSGGRGLSDSDNSEWSFRFATVDVTYLGLDLVINNGVLNRDFSRVQIGADLYLDLMNNDGSAADLEANRFGFGTVTVGADGKNELTDGLEITFDGDIVWPAFEVGGVVSLLSDKSIDLGPVKASLDNLSLDYGNGFAFLFSGSFQLEVEQVHGGISFVNLRVDLNGDISGPEIQGADLSIMDFVSVRVDEINWGSGTISYTQDQTSGEGTNRQPAIGDEPAVINVDSYFEIKGASINIGSGDSSVMSGKFDQFLFYKIAGEQSFVLRNAEVETSGCKLTADIKYDRTYLRVAGGISMQNISGAAVGKIGIIPDGEPRAGQPTFGLFVMVEGLGTMVAPSVFLDSVGGGVFINPTDEDIDTVLAVAGFDRPELDDKIASMRPSGGGNPGSFAVMLMAGVYVAERTLVQGEALITLTGNYFSLDAKVTALEGMLHGRSYFLISWDPPYAEGNNVLEANLFDIFNINGDLAFYAYGQDAWGITGGVRVSLKGDDMASGSFFIGPPGFMMETSVKAGIDIGIVSGYVQFSGMVWYYVVPDPDTWGAWADVELRGSLLWGLVSGKAGIEGALIGQGTSVLIYAAGDVSFEVCGIDVFSGSLWVSIDSGGFDGGKGRNSSYEALINDARNMADAVEEAKSELMTALAEAEMKLYQLDDAQREAAGLALVERSGWVGRVLELSFAAAEIANWPGGLPRELQGIRDRLFGDEEQTLVQLRTELEQLRQDLNEALSNLQDLQNQVLTRLEDYKKILLEDLPGIRNLASSGNPFQGMQTTTVAVGNSSRRVQTGFIIDEDKAESQKEELGNMKAGFAGYQDAFIQRAGLLDSKLSQLDDILFESEQSFTALMERYNRINSGLVDYMERFINFQQVNAGKARENLAGIQYTEVPDEIAGQFAGMTSAPTEQVVRELMSSTAATLNETQLQNWNNNRISLINLLNQAQGGEGDYMSNANVGGEGGLSPTLLFIETGVELWWNLPVSGWNMSIDLSEERIASAIESFHENEGVFRDSWEAATGISDTVFDRKAELYSLLYEIYDQLAVYGSGTMDTVTRPPDRETGAPVTGYFEARRDEIGPYLQFPSITMMDAELHSLNPYSAFFHSDFAAAHPVGVVEYAFSVRPGGSVSSLKSIGMDQNIDEAFFQAFNIQRNYFFDLRARGAGGLSIQRQGSFDLEFLDPEEDSGPFISNLEISDDSPPTVPVVSLPGTITSDPQKLYAQWGASDSQSGIQRYEYAVGTYSSPENNESDGDGEGDVDSGGLYIQGFGSALEPAGQPGIIGGESVPTDIVPWTDAGGRIEAIIKGLDLQHAHEYAVSVRVTNGEGLQNVGSSQPVLVDLTSPEGLQIIEFVQQTADDYPNSVQFSFSPAEDPETGVTGHYIALGSTPNSDDLYPWTEARNDFGRIANVPAAEGKAIYLLVKAVNSVGLESVVSAELEFSYSDISPPPSPMVVTNPQQSSNDASSLTIGWNGVQDTESGITGYSYGLSSTIMVDPSEKPDILDWVDVAPGKGPYFFDKRVSNEGDLTLPGAGDGEEPAGGLGLTQNGTPQQLEGVLGTEYRAQIHDINLTGCVYAVVRVTNGAGLSTIANSQPIIFDSSLPEYAELFAEPKQYSTNQLECRLTAGDPESGIESYRYTIYKLQGGLNFLWITSPWILTETPGTNDISLLLRIREFPPPGLEFGKKYKLYFWVRNRSGLLRPAGPVIIEIDPPNTSGDSNLPGVWRAK